MKKKSENAKKQKTYLGGEIIYSLSNNVSEALMIKDMIAFLPPHLMVFTGDWPTPGSIVDFVLNRWRNHFLSQNTPFIVTVKPCGIRKNKGKEYPQFGITLWKEKRI
jgi:hypothetical protein